MGLAASQARFLGITARKSNIEYEGQQVNQQRTALAEEVNALYNKLLSLKLPIPPDTTDFYGSNYSFNVNNTKDYDGSYRVKSYYQNDDGTYNINAERTYDKNIADGKLYTGVSITETIDEEGNKIHYLNTAEGSYRIFDNAQNSEAMINLINNTYGEGTVKDKKMSYYTDENGQTHYIPASQAVVGDQIQVNTYVSTTKSYTEPVVFQNAQVTLDGNGRFSSISYKDPATGEEVFESADVDTTRYHNDEEYEAALRDYTMSKNEYDKKVADLNAQTESLQQEDKILELRLNQIDTEQNELKTELEAVKAVLDDNIEKTFKTFA